ncbi:PqiC family protein [Lacimicrobium alkaliphilum]|uniref:ABC-type transport auxiliary lipoprotein component domain-containing protein n=1 Tax=Lacimicrobium alkaliphilum TaxID=1526571 RepID=A0ABQ1RRJ1_9ALTE|nr:PqiC family protein [Lacimicrobium alkaliphilum]GGD74869.1 hypothetical protein GCM10011357_32310 [Lacimicrobium alkaliphilum]
MKNSHLLLFVLLLSACSSAPTQITYYMLDNPTRTMSAPNNQAPTVTLQSLNLPDYLRQDGLVMRLSNNRLQLSSEHYWAQRIDASIETIMLKQLNHPDASFHLQSITEPLAQQSDYQLHIQIIHLLIEQQNAVRLQARYWVTKSDSHQSLMSANSDIDIQLTADGYEHAVEKMRQALVHFSDEVSKDISTIVK